MLTEVFSLTPKTAKIPRDFSDRDRSAQERGLAWFAAGVLGLLFVRLCGRNYAPAEQGVKEKDRLVLNMDQTEAFNPD